MYKTEHAYLLQDCQLMLLLSLVDERPVAMFTAQTIEPLTDAQWKQTVLLLHSAGLLEYGVDGVEVSKPLRELLCAMKAPRAIYTAVGKKASSALQTLYSGSRCVLLETSEQGAHRLRELECTAAEWLQNSLGLPSPMATPDRNMRPEDFLPRAEVFPPLCTPETSWLHHSDIAAVLTRYGPDGSVQLRRIWYTKQRPAVILLQTHEGADTEFDTEEIRKRIAAEIQEV